jgi:hypothetical protein
MKLLLSLINKLYGSKAIQKTIGTRTNVITLPNKQTKQLLNEQLNVNQASDQQILKLKDDIEKLIPDIPKMNDSEVLNLTSNLQKIDNRLNPPQAEIIEMGTKQPVSPAGIKQLEAERGMPENVDPNSPLGIIMQRVKKAELESKSIAEEFGMENVLKKGLDDLMRTQTGYPSIQREGMVRTAVREIMTKDLKSGKLKIKDPEVKRNLEKYISSGEDPIETFRKYYGEDRLADIDDVAEELLPAQSYTEIQDILKQKKLYDLPVKKKGAGEYDPAIKEGERITKDIEEGKIKPMNVTPAEDIIEKGDFDPSGMATGGRVGFSDGDITKTKADYEKELEELDFSLKKEDNKILDILDLQAQGAMSGEQQIAGAPAGVTSNKQVINAILKLDIPISEKINLIGDYQYGKFRDKIKYNDKEVYLEDPGSSKNRKIGLSYNEDGEGFSGYGKYNIDTGETEGGIKLIKKFNEGGRVGFSQGKLVGKGITKLLERFAKDKKKSRLLTDDEIEEFAEELGDTETWMSSGTLKEAEEAAKRRKDYEQQMYSEYQVDKQGRKELEQAYKEIDFRMTGEDTKYEANELADMLAETRYKTEMSDLPQKTQIDLYGEAYDYLMEVKRDATNFKGAVDIKSGKNIVTGEQELPLDSMTGKPRKLNATGGRVGFSDGGNEALLEQLYEKFLDLGLSPKDAADAARKEFEQRARKAGGGIAYLMGL